MRPRASALVTAAAVAAATYFVMLVVWRAAEPIYMRALAVFVEIIDAARLLPGSVEAVVVPGRGLAIVGSGADVAVPQRLIGADLALIVALVIASSWLSWRRRARALVAGLLAVFAVHLATVVAQTWVGSGSSGASRAIWNLWTTLYQGKVAPVVIWCLLCVPVRTRASTGTRNPPSRTPTGRRAGDR